MKYLKTFERISRGNLYHIFDLEKCDYILENNTLKSYKFSDISTTRNKNMNGYLGDSPDSIFKIELDGDKISDKYKIKPFSYPSTEIGVHGERSSIRFKEYEEVIKTNKIENINKYVNKFIIIKKRVENLFDSGWFTSNGGHFKNSRINIPQFFKEYIPKIKKLFGDNIYIQDGYKVYKDDEWIENIMNYNIKQINHGYALYYRGFKKSKYKRGFVDDIRPLNIKNKEIEHLVIGYNYDDLYLDKNKKYNFDNIKLKDDYNLYIFDFEYELENVISETPKTINVKTARLADIVKINF